MARPILILSLTLAFAVTALAAAYTPNADTVARIEIAIILSGSEVTDCVNHPATVGLLNGDWDYVVCADTSGAWWDADEMQRLIPASFRDWLRRDPWNIGDYWRWGIYTNAARREVLSIIIMPGENRLVFTLQGF